MIYGGHFDPNEKKARIKKLESEMSNSNFWDDKKHSEEVLNELNFLKSKITKVEHLKNKIESNLELIEMMKENNDEDMYQLILIRCMDEISCRERIIRRHSARNACGSCPACACPAPWRRSNPCASGSDCGQSPQ